MIPPPYSMQHVVAGGMIPMAMMPPMMTHVTVVPPTLPIIAAAPQQQQQAMHQQRAANKRPHSGDNRGHVVIEKKPLVRRTSPPKEDSKGPPVTVFVGNITDRASDGLIRLILQKCGNVVNWKRVQGANGWLQAFGFCEYADPESAMRAIRILHEWEIGDKKLVVKVDAKTKEKLDEYKANKRGPAEAGDGARKAPDDIDEATWRQDRETREAILHLLRSHSAELSRGPDAPPPQSPPRRQNSKRDSPDRDREYRSASKLELDDMDIEEDKRNLITREIDKFRDTYKRQEEERDKDRERRRERKERRERSVERSREREKERTGRGESPRERTVERERPVDRERPADRERTADRGMERNSEKAVERSSSNRGRDRSGERGADRMEERARSERAPSKARSESPERDWVREREREREREMREAIRIRNDSDRDWEREREEEEDAYERKKLERKLREKEAAYQERLRNWEARERRKEKEYEKERLKENERRTEEVKEARRLKEFLEDYDDERDDVKYYKGSALQRRLKEREKEVELDNRDRQREREELEELRRKLAEEGHPDPEAEARRIHHEEEARLTKPLPVPRLDPRPDPRPEPAEPPEPEPRIEPRPVESPVKRSYHGRLPKMVPVDTPAERVPEDRAVSEEKQAAPKVSRCEEEEEEEGAQNSLSGFSDITSVTPQEESKPLGFAGLKLGGSPSGAGGRSPHGRHGGGGQRRAVAKLPVAQAFEEEAASEGQRKKRKLVPLDDDGAAGGGGGAAAGGMNAEEKRKHIKTLIDRIPTSKEDLFAYNFDRSLVDNALMERRIRPWINRKIIEYIGEEEPTLVDFICSKVLAGSAAQSILNDVSMVLDEEAEVFVVKMWRLLIYEIEAKKVGLVK